MKILVTGGAGFIGSAFIRKMAKNSNITLVDKLTYAADTARIKNVGNNVRFYKADIACAESLGKIFKSCRPEIIVNFAAETHVDRSILNPNDFILSNTCGTLNLLKFASEYKAKKFIQISTDEVYGELTSVKMPVFTEDHPLLPNSPYSASKAGADMLVRSFNKTYGLPTVILRPSNNYGWWQYPEKLVPLTISRILKNEKIPIYGKGQNARTWLFVDDCVDAIIKIIKKGIPGEIYNVGGNQEIKNIDLVKKILKIMKKNNSLITFVPDRPGHDFRYAVDTRKIKKCTGWDAKISLDEGLVRTINWYLSNQKWLFKKVSETKGFIRALKNKYRNMGKIK